MSNPFTVDITVHLYLKGSSVATWNMPSGKWFMHAAYTNHKGANLVADRKCAIIVKYTTVLHKKRTGKDGVVDHVIQCFSDVPLRSLPAAPGLQVTDKMR